MRNRAISTITIDDFITRLSTVNDKERLFKNPYRSELCRENLRHYLHSLQGKSVDIMLIGEAPGYRGCALTGIPFTDEVQLKLPENYYALGDWQRDNDTGDTSERSATAVWRELRRYRIIPLIWNVFPFHPYKEGKEHSNRTPTQSEIREGIKYIEMLISIFSIQESKIFAIGKKAQTALDFIDNDHVIRHPAYDLKREFPEQFSSKIGALFLDRVLPS